jgi:hypothetical protein
VTHNAGERSIEKPMRRFLDLVKVVLMYAVEQATVDKSANVGGADLDRHTKKAAVAAIAMPSLTDCRNRFRRHDHLAPWTVTRYGVTGLSVFANRSRTSAAYPPP